jgi:3-methyladenine DNA glycosylase/8-oxoguanine DNA glycosylase
VPCWFQRGESLQPVGTVRRARVTASIASGSPLAAEPAPLIAIVVRIVVGQNLSVEPASRRINRVAEKMPGNGSTASSSLLYQQIVGYSD